jgi:hypothetical protein
MHILELRSENFKRLSVVQITPEGNMIQITGANGEGKTSCLDSIWAALGGKEAVPDAPIRKGKKSARVEVKLGDANGTKYIVERTFTDKESYLKVTDPEGAKHSKPQQILDGLMGAIGFDPLAFMRMEPRKQFEMLRGIVKLDVDIDALDRRRTMLYEERTGLNRDLARSKMLADAIAVPDDLPETEPDIEEITARLAGVAAHNDHVREQQRIRQASAEVVALWQQKVSQAKAELAAAEDELTRAQANAEEAVKLEIAELQDPAAVKAELDAARGIARGFREQDRKIEALAAVTAAERAAQDVTTKIEEIDATKQKALAEAKMPVEGLGFDDGVVLFNGIPITQASGAEQLRISAAIGAALNPKLRVLLCRDGSLLDHKSLKQLAEFAEASTLQVWLERVDESGEVGVVIEDGHVRGQEALVAEHEKAEDKKPVEPAPDDDRAKRARTLLDASIVSLKAATTIVTIDKLNATVKTKLQNFPELIAKEWNPAYLGRVKELKA